MLQTRALTGADLGNPSAGQGPAVQFAPYATAVECAADLERHLDGLLSDGVAPDAITILSTRTLDESSAALLSPRLRAMVREVTPANVGSMPLPEITFARIEDFKGLENNYIAVVDVDRFAETDRDLALVYVAMSRARAGLWVAYSEDLEAEIAAAGAKNLAAIAAAEGLVHD